jgi:hypothetical protein
MPRQGGWRRYAIPQEKLQGQLWITSGNEFPLRVAKGYANLEINAALVRQISDAIGDNAIDLAAFDPLVTLHSVSEGDPGKMDTVVRLFAGIADEHDCAIELNHHVRKPAAGSDADHDVHDIRGVMAIADVAFAVMEKRTRHVLIKSLDFARRCATRLPHDVTWIEFEVREFDAREIELYGERLNFDPPDGEQHHREGWLPNGFKQDTQMFRVHQFRSATKADGNEVGHRSACAGQPARGRRRSSSQMFPARIR